MSDRAAVRKSVIRRIAWFGGDRRLVGGAGLIIFTVGMIVGFGYGMIRGIPYMLILIALYSAIIWVARQFNQSDPWMIDVGLRQLSKYKKYYGPHSDIGVDHPQIKDFN